MVIDGPVQQNYCRARSGDIQGYRHRRWIIQHGICVGFCHTSIGHFTGRAGSPRLKKLVEEAIVFVI
jgi:hypothetical protein